MRRLYAVLLSALLAGCTSQASAPRASAPTTGAATSTVVAGLMARPMHLPTVAAGARCPVASRTIHALTPQSSEAAGLGSAPLYPLADLMPPDVVLHLRDITPDPDGLYDLKVVWGSDDRYQGPVVVRVGRLDGSGRGLVRLYYDLTATHGDATVFTLTGHHTDWPSGTFVSGPGCYAYQVDGVGFSEVIGFQVVQ